MTFTRPYRTRRRPCAGLALALSALTLPAAALPADPAPERSARVFDHTHAAWTRVLRQHVQGDRFDYGALKRDPALFDTYLATLSAVTPTELEGWTKDQRFAFWINTYNAFTIQKVIEEYPLKSIRKLDSAFGLKSVFDKEWIPMRAHHPEGDDDELSPNDIEHGILRKRFPDARLHAAINCASVSCPRLRNEAFVAKRLDAQLTEQMRDFVRDPARNRIEISNKRLRLSQIFKWFADDFKRDAGSVREYVAQFAPEDQREAILASKETYVDYDWDLNDTE